MHRQHSAENSNVLQTMQWKLQSIIFAACICRSDLCPPKPRRTTQNLLFLVHACIIPEPAIKSGNPAPHIRLVSLGQRRGRFLRSAIAIFESLLSASPTHSTPPSSFQSIAIVHSTTVCSTWPLLRSLLGISTSPADLPSFSGP